LNILTDEQQTSLYIEGSLTEGICSLFCCLVFIPWTEELITIIIIRVHRSF